MSFAVDLSSEAADPAEADELVAAGASGALVYSGRDRPGDDQLARFAAAGLAVAWIFESSPTRAYDGYPAGVADGQQHETRVPPGALTYVNAADTPNINGHEHQVADYFRGWGDTTREPLFGAYGSAAALRAAQSGSSKVQRLWGVETWIDGSTGNWAHNLDLWRSFGAHLVQLANVASPVPGTDRDEILSPLWASQDPPRRKWDRMEILVGKRTKGPTAGTLETWAVIGHVPAWQFTGPTNDFGVCLSAVAYATDLDGTRKIDISGVPDGIIDLLGDIANNGLITPSPRPAAPGPFTLSGLLTAQPT